MGYRAPSREAGSSFGLDWKIEGAENLGGGGGSVRDEMRKGHRGRDCGRREGVEARSECIQIEVADNRRD